LVQVLESAAPDTAASVLRVLSAQSMTDALDRLEHEPGNGAARAQALRNIISWPKDSAGGHMTTSFWTAAATMTVAELLEAIRQQRDNSDSDNVYITGADSKLEGVVTLRDLVLADGATLVRNLITPDVPMVSPTTPAEDVVAILNASPVHEVPVVANAVIIGVVTQTDVVDIIEEEDTEDAERQGGSEPLDLPYLQASPAHLWRKRIVWLLVLFAAEMYTSNVLQSFESVLEETVALTFFIPLLIGTGGNTGTQITTSLVRAMATGEVRLRQIGRVISKEMTTAAMISVVMAAAALGRAWMLGVGQEVGIVVSLTIVAIIMWAALVASILPPLIKKLRLDPAVVSGPMITTLVDGTGLVIYFLIAKWILDLH